MIANLMKIGAAILGNGVETGHRGDRTGALVTTDAHARFQEAVLQGRCFGVANQAGITTQAGLSATTPALTLYNPLGSGVNGVLWYAGSISSVAYAAAAAIWVAVNTSTVAAAVTGTLTTAHRNLLLGAANTPSVTPLLAATLPAAPVAIATLGVGLTGAITLMPTIPTLGRWFDGSMILAPGTAVSFQTSTASGTSGFFGEFIWEETLV